MERHKPSPYSTGGGGYEYERMVGATYLAAMVCGDAVPGVADGMITEVRFQQRNAGHILDDIVVVSNMDSNAHRLSLQIKHGLQVGTSSKFKDIISDCWRMFAGGEGVSFDRSTDRLGIVVSNLSGDARGHYLPVLEMARDSQDSAAFWNRLKHDGHSRLRLEFANSIKSRVTSSSEPGATADDVWEFLRLLYIIELDMDGPAATGRTFAEGICRRALAEPGGGEAAKLFDVLRGVAADLAPAGGSIATAALRGRLSSFDLAGHARTNVAARRLDAHSQTVMDGIKNRIAGTVHLDRPALLERLSELAQANAITIIHGEPFAGKSALAKTFAETVPSSGAVAFLGTEYFGSGGTMEAFLSLLGVQENMVDILETHGTPPHRYIIIDGLDRISYEPEKIHVVKGLLAVVSRYNAGAAASVADGVDTSWKIIATTRSMEFEHVENAVKEWCGGRRPATMEAGPLTGEEIDAVRRQLPQLGGDTLRLGGLLSLPGYLDMIARCQPASLEGVQGAVGAGRLYDLFWKDAVLRLGGLRGGKGHGLAREKILVDMADRAYRGLPPADLHDLDHDAVDGLLDDALAKRDGNRLAFAHDVIEDYALARMIEWAEPRRPLFEDPTRSRRLVHPLRICAAKMLEADASADKWVSLLEDCRLAYNGSVWARECLLGAADSDESTSNLDAISGSLLRNGGGLLAKLLAALSSAFLKENPYWGQAVRERGIEDPALHPAHYKLPRDERFSPVLSFSLDNIGHLGDEATAQFIRTAARWTRNGANHDLKRRITVYAVQHADWLHNDGAILGLSYSESDKTKDLVAAIVLRTSGSAPDTVKGFIYDSPSIIHNSHFKRGLIKEYGWIHLCKFLPEVAVDVLSRIMCAGSHVAGSLQDNLGTRDDGWTDLASPYEGPFYPFLVFHSEHGLDLVHKVLNHATDEWCKAQEEGNPLYPPRIPSPHTVRLKSGPVDVYGDEHAFAWCGYTRRAPDLVASALMALELWLDRRVESGEESAPALFDRILQDTRSAAVVGVCCAVALKHMDKSAEAVLPMLANPAFWIMDARRLAADMQAGPIIRMQATLSGRGQVQSEKFEAARRRAIERSKLGLLNAFVIKTLFSGPDAVRTRMQEDLGAFTDHVPVFFKDDADNETIMMERRRQCEMWSKQADKSNYKYSMASEDIVEIVFDEERFLTDDEKRADLQRQTKKKVMDFMMWSYALMEKNKIGPNFTIGSALEYAEQVTENTFQLSLPSLDAAAAVDGRANLAGALIIHRWDEAVEMGVSEACLRYIEDTASILDPLGEDESSYPYGADRAIARALPHCYIRDGHRRGTKRAIRKFADAYNAEVLGFLMGGLRAVWSHDDGLVLECITKARRRSRNKKDWLGHPYTDWRLYAAVLPVLHNIPPTSRDAEQKLNRMVDDMLDDTIAAFKGFEKDRDYGGAYLSFHNAWCPYFFKVLESYTGARPKFRDDVLAKIASHWESAPPLLETFMRWTLYWGISEGRKKDLLPVWKCLLPAVINSKFATEYYSDDHVKKSIFALLIFADPQTAGGYQDRLDMLEGFTSETSLWCTALAGNKHAIEAITSLLSSASSTLLLVHGIGWLWQVLQHAGGGGLSGATVNMLSHLLHQATTCKRPDCALPDLHDKYAWLVDYLVTLNDPVAESLKDEGKNPYANASGRGRR